MTKCIFVILLASFLNFFSAVNANESMIADIEGLLGSLSEKASERKELTLRLADLYFFTAIDLEKKARLSEDMEALFEKSSKFRRRALKLYYEAKNHHKLNDEVEIKVNFQLARIYEQLGKMGDALAFWKRLYKQKQMLNIRQEAILKLAENAEDTSSLKRAEALYKEALETCEGGACGFVRYRLGWVYRNLGKFELALEQMKSALWDKKGQAQDEVLRDYVTFLSQKPGNGSKAITIIENLSKKTGRKDLLEKLAFGFYAAGNKVAGTKALAVVTNRKPTLKNQVQLLEEYYGLRKWNKFADLRERISSNSTATLSKEEIQKIETIMRRLVVQLEAEQKQDPSTTEAFLASSLLYLELFSTSDVAFKIMRSWIALEKNASFKMKKIAYWLNHDKFKFAPKEIIELREERARLAQKEKKYEILRLEMGHLARIYSDEDKSKKASYLVAHSYYEEEQLDKALSLFVELAKVDSRKPSKWSLQAQNLALDIFNQKKDYDGLIRQADAWLKQEWDNPGAVRKDLKEMGKIRQQAEFEKAVAMGENEDALKIFFKYCQEKKLRPQSCQNAKKLAVALKAQTILVSVLQITNEKEALTNEYEISGHYAKAAKLLAEKTPLRKRKWNFEQAIKIALLYELEGDFKKRDKWLEAMIRRYTKKKVPGTGEELFYSALKDAGKLSTRHLSIKWSQKKRQQLVRFLEETGQGNKKTRKLFLAAKESQGNLWEYFHLKKIYELAEKEQGTAFYGKRSKRQFRLRLARIKKLDQYANGVLNQLTSGVQIDVVGVLHASYGKLNQEIRETPMPEGLNEEAMAQVKNSLATMARPFGDKAESYKKLLQTELEKRKESVEGLDDRTYVAKELLAALEKPQLEDKKAVMIDLDKVFPLLRQLNENPLSHDAVSALKELYLNQGKSRLASYYEGRLKSLKRGGNENKKI